MSFVTHEQQSLVWLASPLLGGVRHGFSTRRGGVSPAPWDTLNLGPGRGDAPENVEENYRRFFAALDMDSAYPVLSRQVHRDDVRLCTAADAGKGLIRDRDYDADALITAEKDCPWWCSPPTAASFCSMTRTPGAWERSTPDGGAVPLESWRRPSGRWSACWAPDRNASWLPWGPALGNAALRPTATYRRPCGPLPWGRRRGRIWSVEGPNTM